MKLAIQKSDGLETHSPKVDKNVSIHNPAKEPLFPLWGHFENSGAAPDPGGRGRSSW
jgi:hypothetical protein